LGVHVHLIVVQMLHLSGCILNMTRYVTALGPTPYLIGQDRFISVYTSSAFSTRVKAELEAEIEEARPKVDIDNVLQRRCVSTGSGGRNRRPTLTLHFFEAHFWRPGDVATQVPEHVRVALFRVPSTSTVQYGLQSLAIAVRCCPGATTWR
jgi:hypothetical protein